MPINKYFLKDDAVKLRKRGYSYGMIKNKIGVSKSTLSDWLKHITFVPNTKVIKRMGRGRIISSRLLKKQRILRNIEYKKLAKSELGRLSRRDLLLLGIGLYIGEGAKQERGFIQFSNSDPMVIKLAMNWFTKILKINLENFYLRLHIYPDNDVDETIKFWSDLTNIPTTQFGKAYVDRRENKLSKKRGKLPYGTLHIRIRGLGEKYAKVALYQKVLGWIETVEQYKFAGIV